MEWPIDGCLVATFTAYELQDSNAEARELVEKYGGIEAVVKDGSKTAELMKKLDPGQQMNAMMVGTIIFLNGGLCNREWFT